MTTAAQMLEVDGIPLRVVRRGEGPPLLLINGLGAGLETWDPFVRRIEGREAIAFDLPGAGHSGHGKLPRRMRGLARTVSLMIRELGLECVDLLGYSLGGLVAQEVAHRHPEQVRCLVLAATSPGLPSIPPNPLAATVMLTPARYYDRRFAEFAIPLIGGGRTARDRGVLRRGVTRRLMDPPTLTGYLHQLSAVCGWSSHSWLRHLRTPTLVMHGDQDPLVPLINARYLAKMIPDSELQVLSDAGHLVLIDQPDDAIELIESFLVKRSTSEEI
ncbi:MAG: alpha/beta hydrolase [Solirubrobacterales bacterium]